MSTPATDTEWRLRIDADDLPEGKRVVGLLKTGELAIVFLDCGEWYLAHNDRKCFNLSLWTTLNPPEGWTPL